MFKALVATLAAAALGGANARYSEMAEHEMKALFMDEMLVRHGRQYESSEELLVRFENFKQNMHLADAHNDANPNATFGPNKFSDLSAAEFKARYLNANIRPKVLEGPVATMDDLAANKPPVDARAQDGGIDWRPQAGKYINHVQNQEQCGSCWSFSTTENIASTNAIAGNGLYTLSVQQVVDCDTTSYGCNGGEPDSAYNYVMQAGGLETAESYPYTAQNGQCQANKSLNKVSISSFNWIAQNQGSSSDQAIQAMKTAVATQPLSICAAASTWQQYQGGVITSCDTQIDHCIELDGFTTSDDYWVVRNR